MGRPRLMVSLRVEPYYLSLLVILSLEGRHQLLVIMNKSRQHTWHRAPHMENLIDGTEVIWVSCGFQIPCPSLLSVVPGVWGPAVRVIVLRRGRTISVHVRVRQARARDWRLLVLLSYVCPRTYCKRRSVHWSPFIHQQEKVGCLSCVDVDIFDICAKCSRSHLGYT